MPQRCSKSPDIRNQAVAKLSLSVEENMRLFRTSKFTPAGIGLAVGAGAGAGIGALVGNMGTGFAIGVGVVVVINLFRNYHE